MFYVEIDQQLKILLPTAVSALLTVLTGCSSHVPMVGPQVIGGGDDYLGGLTAPQTQTEPMVDNVSYWDGDGVSGPAKVIIRLSDQTAYFYKGDQLVGKSKVSTGTPTHQTPRGSFKIAQKNKDHRSSLYGVFKDKSGRVVDDDVDTRKDLPPPPGLVYEGADMFHFMRFNGGVGMHAGLLPGYPASHGCVRMPAHMAKIFFENVSIGTPVIVQ